MPHTVSLKTRTLAGVDLEAGPGAGCVLYVTHGRGDGVGWHREPLEWRLRGESASLVSCEPVGDGGICLRATFPAETPSRMYSLTGHGRSDLAAALDALGLSRIHVHSLIGYPASFLDFLRAEAGRRGIAIEFSHALSGLDCDAMQSEFTDRIGLLSTGDFLADPALRRVIEPMIAAFAAGEIVRLRAAMTGGEAADLARAFIARRPRIALANWRLDNFAGSEMWTADMARYFVRLGLEVMVFTPRPGAVSEALAAEGIAVTGDPAEIARFAPDVLHVNHFAWCAPAVEAVGPRPIVANTIHGLIPGPEHPGSARVDACLAVALHAKAKIHLVSGMPWNEIALTPNFFDARRFRPRRETRRRRALLFSSKTTPEQRERLAAILKRAGFELDHTGYGGIPTGAPEDILPRYDLVFAVARSAIEALACGCRVILWDSGIAGPMITEANFWAAVAANFSLLGCVLPYSTLDAEDAGDWILEQVRDGMDLAAVGLAARHLSLDSIGPLIVAEYARAGAKR